MDLEQEVFVVHVAIFFKLIEVHPNWKVRIATLIADKALVIIPAEYLDFKNVFFKESTAVLPEYIEINTHAIELEKGKQPPYGPIYSLGPMELDTLKTYIKTNLVNGFICPSKSPVGTLILFNKKPNENLWLCVNYWGFNNITIKN